VQKIQVLQERITPWIGIGMVAAAAIQREPKTQCLTTHEVVHLISGLFI
jgi:hypothetical protein